MCGVCGVWYVVWCVVCGVVCGMWWCVCDVWDVSVRLLVPTIR